jgi:hypothetical protein
MYTHFFTQSHLRIPIRHFLADLLHHYGVRLAQVVPLELLTVFHFEFCVRALRSTPEIPMFCAFYKLTKAGDWFTFSKRDGLPYHVDYVSSSLKQWKESFLYRCLNLPIHDVLLVSRRNLGTTPITYYLQQHHIHLLAQPPNRFVGNTGGRPCSCRY